MYSHFKPFVLNLLMISCTFQMHWLEKLASLSECDREALSTALMDNLRHVDSTTTHLEELSNQLSQLDDDVHLYVIHLLNQ